MKFCVQLSEILIISIILCKISLTFLSKNQVAGICPRTSNIKNGTIALILARGGSKGIPLKNLAKVNGISLLGRSLRIIQNANIFTEIWVSTDSSLIAHETELYGANVHIRSNYSARDEATSIESVREFLEYHNNVRNIALIQCTSVFLREKYLEEAISIFNSGKYDCVFSVVRSWKLRWGYAADEEKLKPLNFDAKNRPRRQDWSGELVETGMFYFARRAIIERDGVFQNDRCGHIEVDSKDTLEIDNIFHLKLANLLTNLLDA